MPREEMRDARVEGFMASNSAAPLGPETFPLVCFRAFTIRSKAGSGVSRIWYRLSAFKRSASFSGSADFMASTSEQSQTLAAGGHRSQFLRSLRTIVILRLFVVQRIR